ncbi:hypothetical protein [Sphingomonas endophytica]|uniref:Uncharacterized protein n=1 Tax=Sphingomonas endophytica TaxID=869719 RepID=A0A147I3H8_9SPHN|nr:hypothetical protein [Sphingomonas endophytica]KTT72638.1 hypothetical protein NS334_08575 [Sphingomonas endophytica]
MTLDEIRTAILAIHGALTPFNVAGDFAEPLVHLMTAAHVLGEPETSTTPYDLQGARMVPEILQHLVLQEMWLRDRIITVPATSVKAMVALPLLSQAINTGINGYARRSRGGRA